MSEPSITTTPSTLQQTKAIIAACLCVVVLQSFLTAPAQAADELRSVVVADPYLEMHTGPGRGYPIFHVIDRGEAVDIIMQRTSWYLVRSDRGKEGWVDRAQMQKTLQPDGQQVSFEAANIEDFTNARWETGILTEEHQLDLGGTEHSF